MHIASDRNLIDVRFPVQWVIRPPSTSVADYRAYAGQVAGGVMRPGDEVVVLPGGQRSTIAGIDTFDGPVEEAFPPMSVALRLADDIDVGRGSTIVRTQNQPTVSNSFEALLCWMSEQPLDRNRRYQVKHTTRTAMVGGLDVRYRIDVESLHRDESATVLELNDLGRVRMELSAPLVFDSYRRNRTTGSLIVIDEATNETVAAGVILDTEVEDAGDAKSERSPNVRWQGSRMTRERRWKSLGHSGATLWFTGPAGRRQVDDRRGGRGAAGRHRPVGLPARRRQPAPRAQRRPRDSTSWRAARTSGARRTWRGCWPSPGRSRSSASSAPTWPIARPPPSCTPPTTFSSSRSSWTLRWSCARSATPRACTRARGPVSSRA